jgi:hypothetical protein
VNVFRQVKTVLWGFFGVAPRDARGQHEKTNPFVLIGVALVAVLVFLGTLAFIVHQVAKP